MKRFISLILVNLCLFNVFPQVQNNSDITSIKDKKPELLTGYLSLSQNENTVKGAVYADPERSPEERANDLISRMTFEEKIALTSAGTFFNVAGIDRLGIRSVTMADASQGLRMGTVPVNGKSTSMPGMLPLASTWNTNMAKEFGRTMAEECHMLGVDILLGPSMNMQRQSIGGRNYENMGEDPLLTAEIATAYIQGLQSLSIVPTAKHFVANDQEFVRHMANSIVDERTLREMYLPPWKAIIEDADCMGIMSGNNVVNGIPCSMHKPLVADVLRKEYGFEGIAMTDWANTRFFPYKQGLMLASSQSILMSTNESFVNWLNQELAKDSTKITEFEEQLETMIYPNLYTFFKMGIYDRQPQDVSMFKKFSEHQSFARKCAEEAIVLLKNSNNILPITQDQKIVMVGKPELYTGTGSGRVKGYDHTTYAMGLKEAYGDNFRSIENIDEAVIKAADVIIFNLNKTSGEGHDIPFEEPKQALKQLEQVIQLNKNIVVLLNAANSMPTDWLKSAKGVVWCSYLGQERGHALADVISGKISPSGKLTFTFEKDFKDSPDPEYNYLGDAPYWEGNNQYEAYWLGHDKTYIPSFTNYVKPHQVVDIPYNEGIFIGYRWFEANNKPIVFPFGFGLSYTQFKYNKLSCSNTWSENQKVSITFQVTNNGNMQAKEVVQVYVSDKKSSVERPIKELKAFKKINLKANESKTISFELDKDAFAFWSTKKDDWVVEKGDFKILVGSSSADIHLKQTISIK